jgi:gliding motility-associated-like protein/uncharacterized repeat protein (TIGR01451 family)
VTDNLPAGYTLVSATPTLGTWLSPTWTIGNLANGGSATLTIVATVLASGPYANTATITGAQTDPILANNTSTVTPTPVPITDLSVVKTVDNLSPNVGSNVTFTITAHNNGPSPATGVSVTDNLPAGYTLVSATPTLGTWLSPTWTIGNLANGGSATLTIVATVLASGPYANTATITGTETDPNLSNNTSTVTPIPVPITDLSVVKTVDNPTPNVGSNVTFTITAHNYGPSPATGVTVTDNLPAGYSVVSVTPSGSTTWSAPTWTIGNLANGGSATLTIVATVLASGPYANTATITGAQTDPILANNTSTVTPVPVPITDLSVVKTVNNPIPSVGSNVTFTITAHNNGPSPATGVSVTDNLPAGYTLVSATPSTGTWLSPIWTIGNLANGASATLTIVATVLANGPYDNTATITGAQTDPVTGNNTSTVTPVIQPIADAGPDATICEGSTFTLSGSSASHYASLLWTTSGTGTYNNATILHPVYTPSMADILAGTVKLYLQANGNPPAPAAKDSMTLTITRAPIANAGPDGSVCQGQAFTVSGATAQYFTTLLWTHNGTGTLSGTGTLTPTYFPGNNETGPVTLTLTVTGNQPCGSAADQMTLNVIAAPQAYAGTDATICEGSSYTIPDANASNYIGILWTSNGLGTLTNTNTLSPTYTPATNEVGTITITLTVFGNFPCGTAMDMMFIHITPKATAAAGPDISSCGAAPVTLAAATATNYISLVWSTSGSGTFNNPALLNPVYTPSAADILNGHIILTITAIAGNPCPEVSDNMTLTISKEAIANAGPDQSTCEGVSYTLMGASAQNYSSILWTHNGTGTLTGANTINPTYNPGTGETGQVILTLTVTPFAPCQAITDQMVLTISKSATATAGPDMSVCGETPVTLSGASASNYQSLTWTTSGTGTFSDIHIVNAVYTPSMADIATGTVVLTMTIDPIVPCAIKTSHMTLSLTGAPVASAGPDGFTCSGVPYTVTGASAVNYGSLLWTTNGLGVLSGQTTLTPTYAPAPGESGTITLTLTIHGTGGCSDVTATSQMNIVVGQAIIVNAGNDQTIPPNTSTLLQGIASGGTGGFGYSWQPATMLIDASSDHPETVILDNDVTFILTVTDLLTGCQNTDTVKITINEGVQKINARNDHDTTAVNIPVTAHILTNDSYSRNLPVTITLCGGPENGHATVLSDSTIRYNPNQGFSGIDSLCYILCYDQYPELCDTAEVYIFISTDSPVNWLIIRNIITPNNDGSNDVWYIDGIEEFPDNSIQIFNRWGDKVKAFEHYDNVNQVWKGDNFKGEPLPDGTYYYILTIRNGGTRTGWVLIRGSSL